MKIIAFISTLLLVVSALEDRLRMTLIGDFGDIDALQEAEKAFDVIDKFYEENPFDFFVTLGDNVYYTGIDSPDDPRFNRMYKLFTDRENLKDLDVYGTLGNHDCYGNPQAEVDVSSKPDNHWIMEGLGYSKAFEIDGDQSNGPELGLIVLNGCQLVCLSEAPEEQCDDIDHSDERGEAEYRKVEEQAKALR